MTFINVEPYKLQDVDGSSSRSSTPNGQLQATDVTNEWGLLSEPWIFAVDRDGIVRGSYELTITPTPSSTPITAGSSAPAAA